MLISIFISTCFSFLFGDLERRGAGKGDGCRSFFYLNWKREETEIDVIPLFFRPIFFSKRRGMGNRNRIHSSFVSFEIERGQERKKRLF